MGWRDILPVHPAADALPLLSPEALQELADDIKANGLLEPPTLWHDIETDKTYLLDGRNRLDALELNGTPGVTLQYERLAWHLPDAAGTSGESALIRSRWPVTIDSGIDDPTVTLGKESAVSNTRTFTDAAGVVIAENLVRRHLPAAERAALALAVRATTPTRDPEKLRQPVGVSLGGRGKTGEAAVIAKEVGVSVRTVERAVEKARRDAAPKWNSEAYKLQQEKQAKAAATREAKRDAERAEYAEQERAEKAKRDAKRAKVQQRLLAYSQEQVDLGGAARLAVMEWLTEAALNDNRLYGQGEKWAEDLMRGGKVPK